MMDYCPGSLDNAGCVHACRRGDDARVYPLFSPGTICLKIANAEIVDASALNMHGPRVQLIFERDTIPPGTLVHSFPDID